MNPTRGLVAAVASAGAVVVLLVGSALPADAVPPAMTPAVPPAMTPAATPAMTPAVLPAPADITGVFAVDCDRTVRKALDPIRPAGLTTFSHRHDFFGVRRVSADSRPRDLLTGSTSCSLPQDHSAYWMPTLFNHGRAQAGDQVQAYYFLSPGAKAIPRGLVMVAGDATRSGGTDPRWSSWSCQPSTDYRQPRPPACPSSGWITVEINFPSCWDGRRLDSADHRSHMAYPVGASCPSSHPAQLAQLVLFRNFNQYAGLLDDITLSSGSAGSLHADFVSGWDPKVFDRLIRECGQRDCGHITALPGTSTPAG